MVIQFGSIATGLPQTPQPQEEVVNAWIPYLWLGIGLILAGGLPAGLVVQAHVLETVSLKTAQKVFKIGYLVLIVGVAILIWTMMPGHLLP